MNVRFILFFIISVFNVNICFSQISTGEIPVSSSKNLDDITSRAVKGGAMISLKTPDMKRIFQEDSVRKRNPNALIRTSVPIHVDLNSTRNGFWTDFEDGGKIWQLAIHATDATGIDLVFSRFWLPEGGKFFVFNPSTKESIGAFTSSHLKGSKSSPNRFSTSIIKGDVVVLEYYQPEETQESPIIELSKVYYTYIQTPGFNTSCSYEVNVNCEEGLSWQKEKNAVALVYGKFEQGGVWFSGSLVNNTQNDLTPLFLTANHCIVFDNTENGGYLEKKDAIDDPSLSDWIFYWGYETATCSDTSQPNYNNKTTMGATVKANNEVYAEFALLQLTQNPWDLTDYEPYYLGWDVSGNSNTGGVGIHHPKHDVKKISTYNTTPQTSSANNSPQVYWKVGWIATTNGHGITENGSSGSPLINNNHKVIGQLYAASTTCTNLTGNSYYGKLGISWNGNGASDSRRRLKDWLDPINSGVSYCDGIGRFEISGSSVVCGTQTYYVSGLPTGMSVSWSLTFNSGSSAQLATDTPSTNQCQVTRTASTPFSATLTATITYQGQIIKTLTKALSGNIPIAMSFYTYSTTQGGAGLPHPFGTTNYINVVPNTYYYVTSPSLPGMTLTPSFPSGVPGYTMTRVSETEIRVSLPPSGFMTVAATGSGCDNFSFTFAASSSKSYTLNISGEGDLMQVSLVPNTEVLNARNAGQEEENINWTLEVYESTKAELTASQKVTGLHTTIDTSRWKPGIYIVRALIGDETLTEKINLK